MTSLFFRLFASCVLAGALFACGGLAKTQQPHIVFILVDDMGYNDFYDSSDLGSVAWSNVNRLALKGLKLDSYYTQPICTPTRGALMTGRYPVRLGLQHMVIAGFQDYGLPLDEVTLADKLKSVGYGTYAVGKWHLGLYNFNSTPTYRGFDKYFGYWNGAEDYVTHEVQNYLDLHSQNGTKHAQVSDENGTFSTPLFASQMESMINFHKENKNGAPFFGYFPLQNVHAPLESPGGKYDEICSGIPNSDRRIFCAMAAIADEAIGNITSVVESTFGDEDYVIVIAGDNGGMPMSAGNNAPLRGHKAELWEGGIRNNALILSNMLPEAAKGAVYDKGIVHVTDFHATILGLSRYAASSKDKALDGIDVWDAVTQMKPSPRTEFLANIDPCAGMSEFGCEGEEYAYVSGDLKLLVGVANDTWYPVPTNSDTHLNPLVMHDATSGQVTWAAKWFRDSATPDRLYNISADPTETTNLASKFPSIVKQLKAKVDSIKSSDDFLAPCNIPDGSCYDQDSKGSAAAASHGGWYPWM